MPPALSRECIPTMKGTINIIEENEDGAPIYQGKKVKRYLQEKQYIKNHAVEILEKTWLALSNGSVVFTEKTLNNSTRSLMMAIISFLMAV